MIKVVTTINEFEELEKDWRNLYVNDNRATPYQSYSFNILHWKYWAKQDDTLHVITVYRQLDNSLILLLPCFLDKRRNLRYITDIYGDFCCPLCSFKEEESYNIYEEVVDYIMQTEDIKGILLSNVRSIDPFNSYLSLKIKGCKYMAHNGYSLFRVSNHSESEIEAISTLCNAKDKNRLKKIRNKMKSTSYFVYSKNNNDDYPQVLIEQLMSNMVKQGLRTSSYFSDTFKRFVKDLYNKCLIEIVISKDNNEVNAACASFKKEGHPEYIQWLALYTEKQYNLWNILHLVNYLYVNNGGIVNFARGIYEYKNRNFRPALDNLYVLRFQKTKTKRILQNIRDILKY